MTPRQAALDALGRIVSKYNDFAGAVIVLKANGQHSAACHNLNNFPYVVTADDTPMTTVRVPCSSTKQEFDHFLRASFTDEN